jgi:LysR family nod box-dependent transcriptional activator
LQFTINNLNLNLLVNLHALLEEQSVSRAADRMFLSQSAMSDALARLRDFFNDDLFIHIGKTMVPTPLAQSLVQPVRDVLIQVQAISSATIHFDPLKTTRRVRFMSSDYIARVLLTRVLPRLSQEAPSMTIELLQFNEHYMEEFNKGHLDLLTCPEEFASDEHPTALLYEESFKCVAWSKNRLIGKKLTVDQYFSLGHVCVNFGEWRVPTYVAHFLTRYGKAPRRVEVTVPNFGTEIGVITGTNRIATVHRRHAEMFARQYSLKLLDPPFDIPPMKMVLQWHKFMDKEPSLVWLRNLILSVAKEI